MDDAAHIGIEYTDFGPRIAVIAGGALHTVNLVPDLSDELILLDPQPRKKLSGLGVAFPTLLDMVGRIEAQHLIGSLLRTIFKDIHRKVGRQSGRAVFAVPMGMTSGRRGALVGSAEEAGFSNIELVDASIPSGMVYSNKVDRPTTQLVYHLGYGDCEYALLRVVRGRVKVIESGVAESLSGQLMDLQMMEAIVLALRERNVFLGLKSFRPRQWMLFRRIVAKAREELGRKPIAHVALPPSLLNQAGSIRITLSATGLAARFAPAINGTIDDMSALLERNEVTPAEIDVVIALGDTATRSPVAPLLAKAFPGKVMLGSVGTVAAAAAVYSMWLERDAGGGELGIDLSHYLTPYEPSDSSSDQPAPAGAEPPPLVTAIEIEETAGLTTSPADPAPKAEAKTEAAAKAPAHQEAADNGAPSGADAAKELIEQGRYSEAIEVLQRLASAPKSEAPAAPPAGPSMPEALMQQAESFLERGLYAEGVALAHRAYQEGGSDNGLFARMLQAHVTAALAMKQREQYDDAIQILMCAHGHDQTDRGVHQALAARHCEHAEALHALGDNDGAREAVMEALRFDPKNPRAQALFDELSAAPEPRPA